MSLNVNNFQDMKPSKELKPIANFDIMRPNSVVFLFQEAQFSTKTASECGWLERARSVSQQCCYSTDAEAETKGWMVCLRSQDKMEESE